MAKNTELTSANLLAYPSEKLAKAADGGGLMRGVPLAGTPNELFNPTSDVELVNGGFDARLVYLAVLTSDLSKLYGAYAIVGERPEMSNVSVLLFPSAYYGEQYANAKVRIESYSAPTIESRMTMMGKALGGSKLVQAYQRVGEALPLVGERYCLQSAGKTEYFRIAKVSGEARTFTDNNGDFQRLVVKMELQDALTQDHQGIAYPARGYAKAETKILETQVADSAHYYGARPLTAPALKGSSQVKVDSLYEQLVPTSTTDTAWADQYPAGVTLYIPLGAERELFSGNARAGGSNLYLPCAVLPGSVKCSAGYIDNGKGQLVSNSGSTYDIDYASGVIRVNAGGGYMSITAVPAARVSNSAYSSYINIEQTNQSTEWAPFLTPKPAAGSARVSWLSGGQWYDLEDKGDYQLYDAQGKVRGIVSRDGSCAFSLPDMPDVGSKIVVMWAAHEYYRNINDQSPEATVTPVVASDALVLIGDASDTRPIKPGTVQITAAGKSARDDGAGNLTGDITGRVDYADGSIYSADIGAAEVQLTCERYTTEAKSERLVVSSNESHVSGSLASPAVAGTVMMVLNVSGYKTDTTTLRSGWTQFKNNNSNTGVQRAGAGFVRNLSGMASSSVVNNTPTTGTETQTQSAGDLLVLTDDGQGNLLLNGKTIGTINYQTGLYNIQLQQNGVLVNEVKQSKTRMTTSSPELTYSVVTHRHTQSSMTYEIDSAAARYVSGNAAAVAVSKNFATGKNTFAALAGKSQPCYAVQNSWRLRVGAKEYTERGGVFYDRIDHLTGNGKAVGEIDAAGNIRLDVGHGEAISITSGVYVLGGGQPYAAIGRTPAAPVLPQSFSIRAKVNGKVVTAQAQADGSIAGDLRGQIDEATGFFAIVSDDPMQPETLRYNVTTQSYLPLPKKIIGIDTTRLRPDGKTPIFRAGDTVVLHHRAKHELGSAFTGGQTLSVGRNDVDFIAVKDAAGKHVVADKYDYDLDAGTITWGQSLDLSQYQMPLTAYTSREQLNRITAVDISGNITLQNPLGREYPQGSLVSSALVHGTLEASWTNPFEQRSWTNVWQSTRIGEEILAKLNTTDYPIEISNDGAISERWLLLFKDDKQFDLIGEHLGLIARTDTLQDLTPINPTTQKPYFTIKKEAFGTSGNSIWAAGNCIRFDTTGTSIPVWIVKTVQPSVEKQTGTDGFDVCLRGNTSKL